MAEVYQSTEVRLTFTELIELMVKAGHIPRAAVDNGVLIEVVDPEPNLPRRQTLAQLGSALAFSWMTDQVRSSDGETSSSSCIVRPLRPSE